MKRTWMWSLPVFAVAILVGGCPTQDVGDVTALQDSEKTSVNSAVRSAAALANAVGTSQSLINPSNGTAQNNNATFGTCPVVTLTLQGIQFSATADFGNGCTPEGSGYECAGSASGTLSLIGGTVNLTFNSLRCDNKTLGGTASLIIGLNEQTATANGTADVTLEDGGSNYSANGDLAATYNRSNADTTINSFDGTVSDGTDEGSVELAEVLVSFATNGNFIPSAGTATVTNGVRTITVTFNAQTPTTGIVSVSINGNTPFDVDIDNL